MLRKPIAFFAFALLLCQMDASPIPVRIVFNGYTGWMNAGKLSSGWFELLGKDTTLMLEQGPVQLSLGREAGSCESGEPRSLCFQLGGGGISNILPKEAASAGPEAFTLTLNTVQVYISPQKYRGFDFVPSCYDHDARHFRDSVNLMLLPGILYSVDNGSFWDTAAYQTTKSGTIPLHSRFYFSLSADGTVHLPDSTAATSNKAHNIFIKTERIWFCPCHFGNKVFILLIDSPSDTLDYWQLVTIISGLPGHIRIFDRDGNLLEDNYFLPPKNGVLKRKHLLRLPPPPPPKQ